MTFFLNFKATLEQRLGHDARSQHGTTTDDVPLGFDKELLIGLEVNDNGALYGAIIAITIDEHHVQLGLWPDCDSFIIEGAFVRNARLRPLLA